MNALASMIKFIILISVSHIDAIEFIKLCIRNNYVSTLTYITYIDVM